MNAKDDAQKRTDNCLLELLCKALEDIIDMTADEVHTSGTKIKPEIWKSLRASALKVLLLAEKSSNEWQTEISDSSDTESDDSYETESDPNEVKNPNEGVHEVHTSWFEIKPESPKSQRASALKVFLFGNKSSNEWQTESSDSSDTESDDSYETESDREDPNEVKNPKKGGFLFGKKSSNEWQTESSDSSDTESDDSYETVSDREDPNEAKNPKKGKTIYYKDFFEGNALVTPNKIEEKAVFTPYDVYLDYKQIFVDMLTIIEEVPNDFKHDISGLLYPMLVLVYLRMVVGGQYKMAKKFLQENEDYLEDIYDRGIAKLRRIRRPNQVPGRALELIFGKDLILLEMPKASLLKLLEYIDTHWMLVHRELFLAHIVIDGYDENTPPRKRPPLRRPPLEEIKWADLTHPTINDNLQEEERHKQIKSCFLNPPLLEEGDEVICASFLQDGCWLGTASVHFTIRLVAVQLDNTVTLLNSFIGHKGKVYTGDISPDRRFLISCSLDGTMRLWCLVFDTCMNIYNQISPVRSVVFSPMGQYFATASEDRLARLWLANCDEPILQISGHLAELDVCIFHPNGRYLTTGSADLTVRMWDIVNRGEQVRLFYNHYKAVTALAFSRSGRYLVSGGSDFVFVIWDIADELPLRSLLHHKAPISTIGFAMDDSRLAVGCLGTYLSIWNFDTILESQESRDKPILIFSHPNKGGPIFKTGFVQHGVLISICSNTFGYLLAIFSTFYPNLETLLPSVQNV